MNRAEERGNAIERVNQFLRDELDQMDRDEAEADRESDADDGALGRRASPTHKQAMRREVAGFPHNA